MLTRLADSLGLVALLPAIYGISASLFVHALLEGMHVLVQTQMHLPCGLFSQCEVAACDLQALENQSWVRPQQIWFSLTLDNKTADLGLFSS